MMIVVVTDMFNKQTACGSLFYIFSFHYVQPGYLRQEDSIVQDIMMVRQANLRVWQASGTWAHSQAFSTLRLQYCGRILGDNIYRWGCQNLALPTTKPRKNTWSADWSHKSKGARGMMIPGNHDWMKVVLRDRSAGLPGIICEGRGKSQIWCYREAVVRDGRDTTEWICGYDSCWQPVVAAKRKRPGETSIASVKPRRKVIQLKTCFSKPW